MLSVSLSFLDISAVYTERRFHLFPNVKIVTIFSNIEFNPVLSELYLHMISLILFKFYVSIITPSYKIAFVASKPLNGCAAYHG